MPPAQGRLIDEFLSGWIAENLKTEDLTERHFSIAELASQCRVEAMAAGYRWEDIERRLGATLEEAVFVAVDAHQLFRQRS